MSEHIFKESLKELAEAAIKRGWDAGYDAAIKDVVAWLEQRTALLLKDHCSRDDDDPAREILFHRSVESSALAGQIERGEVKGASNE